MKNIIRFVGLMVMVPVVSSTAIAADAGDSVFPVDLDRKARAELIYESRERDLDAGGSFEADVFTLRIHTDVGPYASLDFDLGAISPSGGDAEFYGGAGLRFLAYDGDNVRLIPFAQGHYAPGIEADGAKYEDLIDFDGGLLLAGKIEVDDSLSILPYAGPAFSLLRLSGDGNADAEADTPVGAVAGIALKMPGQNTFRFEAQYFDNFSFSLAAGIAF